MKNAAIRLIESYTSSFEGITEERCYDEGVDHERCNALRRHFERDRYGTVDSIGVEAMLLFRAGWNDETIEEIVLGMGRDAVFHRAEWLMTNMQPLWYRIDLSDEKRRRMLDELISMRPIAFDHSEAENVCNCGSPGVKGSDPVPQRVVDEYHRDLVDTVLNSPIEDFSLLAAIQLENITEEDREALLPTLECRNAFRRRLAAGILISDALSNFGREETSGLMAPLFRFYMQETDAAMLFGTSLYVNAVMDEPSLLERASPTDRDAVLNVLGKTIREDDRENRMVAIQILTAILPSLAPEGRETAAGFLLIAADDDDAATRVAALRGLARIRPLAAKDPAMLGEVMLSQVDRAISDELIDGSEGMRRAIASELSLNAGYAVGPIVTGALEEASSSDTIPEVRSNAMRALAASGALTPDVVLRGLRDRELSVRRSTVRSIAAMRGEDEAFAFKTLERCLRHRNPDIRAEALLALWDLDEAAIGKERPRFKAIMERELMRAIAESDRLSDPALIMQLMNTRNQLSCENRLSDTL